jgi:hypothetical protein
MAFEGDWPGFFIRGDELPIGLLTRVAGLLRDHSEDVYAKAVDKLAERMMACVVEQDWRSSGMPETDLVGAGE